MLQHADNTERKTALFAKAIAVTAVVLLHALALLPETIYTTSDYRHLFVFVNQAARFSVPLFLALSGFGLARKYQNQQPETVGFLSGRLRKLLPLYLLWSGILIVVLTRSNTWFGGQIDLWPALLLGGTDYHLYFIPLILQLYVLFALISKILPRRHFLWALLGAALLQVLFFAAIRLAPQQAEGTWVKLLLDDQIQYRLMINWVFYFLLGTFVAQINLEWLRSRRLTKPLLTSMVVAGIAWAVVDTLQVIEETGNAVFATSFTRLPVLVYATGFVLIMILYGHRLMANRFFDSRAVWFVGTYSYVIYLSHTLVLRILDGMMTGEPRVSTIVLASILFAGGSVVSGRLSS